MNAVTNTTSLKAAVRRALQRPNDRSGWSTLYAGVIGALAAPVALADPTGGTVVEGDADINPQGNGTVINQTSQRAIIDWETFNIGVDEYVLFNQPGSSAVILNRVIGGDPSTILGNLTANGQVFLVNPNGVFFGESAMLDVGGLLATTLDISNADFMAGNYAFEKTGSSHGEVINAGQITARDGGYVVLAGDKVSNSGVIAARAGHVVLAAGRAITLDVEGDGLVNFAVDEATLSDLAGVHNAGDILADGGLVLMTAKVASELVTTAVNNEGLIQAHGISEQQDGTIVLTAEGADIVNAGVLDADGINSNAGGVIYLHGDENVDLTSESVITADGAGSAEGGVVRAIAKETLWFREGASITATGGNENGGFVEVSGHGGLQLRGSVITGAGGSFIIDPSLVTLSSNSASTGSNIIQVSTLEGYLNANDNVAIIASNSITANGSVSSINATGSGDLRFVIGNVPSGSSGLCGFDPALCVNPIAGGTVINLLSGGTINLSGVDINIAGDFSATASQGTVSLGTIIANTIKVVNATTITVNGNLTANGASTGGLGVHLDVNGLSGMITVNGAITATNGGITLTNSIGRDSLGAPVITVTGSSGGKAISAAGDININADGGIQLGTDTNGTSFGGFVGRRVTSTAGSITIQSGVSIYTGTLSAINGNIALTAVGSSTLGGNPNATILVGSNAGFGTTGFNITAGGNITINATAGTSNGSGGFAQITAGNITTGGTIAVTANGFVGSLAKGDSRIDIGNIDGGIIDLTANAIQTGNLSASSANGSGYGVDIDTTGSGSNNARIFIDGTITTTAGGVSLSVSNGDIIIAGSSASGKAIDAAGDVKLTAADTIQIGTGAITDSGNYDARSITATGNIDLQAGGSYIAAGSLNAGGNINVINSAAGAAQILLTDLSASAPTTRANVTAGGTVNIAATANNGFGSNTRIIVGDVSGTSVNMRAITFDSYGGDAIINAGDITATTGSLTLLASNSGGVNPGGSSASAPPAAASIDVGNLNAGTTLSVTATANPNQASGGHITAGTISAEVINIEHNAAQADIALGAITANNTDGKASVSIITGSDPGVTQAGSITIGGDVTISGTSVSLSIPSSSFAGLASINGNLIVTATNGNIDTGTGSLAVSANAVLFSAAGDILLSNSTLNVGSGSTGFAGDSETATAAGLAGETPSAAFIAGGTLDLGNLAISGNYLWLQANTFGTIGSVGLPSTALVQFTTHDANRLLGLEATSAQTSLAGFYVSNFSAADTLAFGDSAHLGGLLMAEFGEVNLSANNLIFATDGDVTGTNPVYGADVTFLTDTLSNITARLNTGIVNVTAGNNIDLTMAGPAIFSFGSDTFGNVGLITTGDLTLQSGLSAADILLQANTGAVLLGTNTLTATNAITLDADTTFTGTGLLTATTLNLIGGASTDYVLISNVSNLNVTGGNDISLDNTGNLNAIFAAGSYGNVSLI
ncbi:MAG TPA: filamentous hemagglutinin N-terminal domain-containing protein, partial [Gammaproteobacteria bacterium]|nr:filamentous hemagglutinin N-terminal domain-containing protein [Gammaproteobacteria bacterium]